jgi:hypothetical protein
VLPGLSVTPVAPLPNLKTLCSTCKGLYMDAGFSVERVDGSSPNESKHTCDYCNTRTGFDYEVSDEQFDK